jgi:hypothetical protein
MQGIALAKHIVLSALCALTLLMPQAAQARAHGVRTDRMYSMNILMDGRVDEVAWMSQVFPTLARRGIGGVACVIPVFMSSPTAADIALKEPYSPSDGDIAACIAIAHRYGMPATLRVTIDESNFKRPAWRGSIAPRPFAAFAANYTAMIVHVARIAARARGDEVVVGAELMSLERQTGFWQAVIAQVRAVYHGRVAYSMNWESTLRPAPDFLRDVDVIGVDAYFPLAVPPSPTVQQYEAAMRRAWGLMAPLRRFHKEIAIHEIGMPARHGAAKYPWEVNTHAPIDPSVLGSFMRAACTLARQQRIPLVWWSLYVRYPLGAQPAGGYNPLQTPDAVRYCTAP